MLYNGGYNMQNVIEIKGLTKKYKKLKNKENVFYE